MLDGPPPLPVGGAPGADQAAGQCDHQTRSEDPEHAAQQHRDPGHQGHDIMTQFVSQQYHSPLNLLLDHLVLLGAAELVLGSPAAEDVLVVVAGGAVEARVPFTGSVNVARAVFRAQDG